MKKTDSITLRTAHTVQDFDSSPTLTLKQEKGGLKQEKTKQETENHEIVDDSGFVKHEDPKLAIAMPEYCLRALMYEPQADVRLDGISIGSYIGKGFIKRALRTEMLVKVN